MWMKMHLCSCEIMVSLMRMVLNQWVALICSRRLQVAIPNAVVLGISLAPEFVRPGAAVGPKDAHVYRPKRVGNYIEFQAADHARKEILQEITMCQNANLSHVVEQESLTASADLFIPAVIRSNHPVNLLQRSRRIR
jgi:hypothetical protein